MQGFTFLFRWMDVMQEVCHCERFRMAAFLRTYGSWLRTGGIISAYGSQASPGQSLERNVST